MAYVGAIVLGVVFGAVDQYLGTVHVTSRLGWWTITVSGMSAPWLIVPFLVGTTQDRARKAAVLGFIVTMSALVGYFVMSNSGFEGVPLARFLPRTVAMVRSGTNPLWIASGALTGPLYAYLGHRWRVSRSWIGAALVTLALCFESLARYAAGTRISGGLSGSPVVWWAEVAIGLMAALCFAWFIAAARQSREAVGSR
jgi:hypothetical protein